MKALAAFDLDGTLTRRDTMQAFIRYVVGVPRFYWGLCWFFPMIFRLKVLKSISRTEAKSRYLRYFFKNENRESLEHKAKAFAVSAKHLFRKDSLARLQWHKDHGHDCVIVSASVDIWVKPLAASLNIPSLSSEAQYEKGQFVGVLGENCHGPEKVRKLKAYISDSYYDKTYAYGDTSGDNEMLSWADEGYWADKPIPLWE